MRRDAKSNDDLAGPQVTPSAHCANSRTSLEPGRTATAAGDPAGASACARTPARPAREHDPVAASHTLCLQGGSMTAACGQQLAEVPLLVLAVFAGDKSEGLTPRCCGLMQGVAQGLQGDLAEVGRGGHVLRHIDGQLLAVLLQVLTNLPLDVEQHSLGIDENTAGFIAPDGRMEQDVRLLALLADALERTQQGRFENDGRKAGNPVPARPGEIAATEDRPGRRNPRIIDFHRFSRREIDGHDPAHGFTPHHIDRQVVHHRPVYGEPLVHDNTITASMQEVSTRLWPFPPKTQGRLINWGYALADAALRKYVDGSLAIGTWPAPEHPL